MENENRVLIPVNDGIEISEDSNISIVDFMFILVKWKTRIALIILSTVILTFGITLLMSKWYRSSAVVVIPDKSNSPLDLLSGSIGSLSSGVIGINKSGNERYLAILNSRRLHEELVKKYDLIDVFEQKNMEETVKIVQGLLFADVDKKLGTISVTWEFKDDPGKTAEMTNFVIQKLDEINRELATEQARSARMFIEKRYIQAKEDLAKTEDSLNVFQNKYGVIEIKAQTEASIKAAATLYGEIVATETEYQVKKKSLGSNHPEILNLESKLMELQKTKKQMETGRDDFDVFIPFKESPDLALKYFRLYRDVQINNKILEFLVPQYEQAKIQEAKDTPTLLVLDKAVPPERHYRPKKVITSIYSAIISFLVIAVYLFMRERYKRWLRIETTSQKLHYIVKNLKIDKIF